MTTRTHSSGFTLIELLVVIAIIGVLAALAVGSLGLARKKGNDAGIISNLINARSQAELFYSSNNNVYVGTLGGSDDVCAVSASVNGSKGIYPFAVAAASAAGASISTSIVSANTANASVVTCHATPTTGSYAPLNAWALEAPLKADRPGYTDPFYCVDSTNVSTTTNGSTLGVGDAKCN